MLPATVHPLFFSFTPSFTSLALAFLTLRDRCSRLQLILSSFLLPRSFTSVALAFLTLRDRCSRLQHILSSFFYPPIFYQPCLGVPDAPGSMLPATAHPLFLSFTPSFTSIALAFLARRDRCSRLQLNLPSYLLPSSFTSLALAFLAHRDRCSRLQLILSSFLFFYPALLPASPWRSLRSGINAPGYN